MQTHPTFHPFIIFVDKEGNRIDQIDLWAVDAPSYHEAMVAASQTVSLYVNGAQELYAVLGVHFEPRTGYTHVHVQEYGEYRKEFYCGGKREQGRSLEAGFSGEMEGQMSIDDYNVGGC